MSPLDSLAYYKRMLRAGFMAMNPLNGQIKAWVGGANYKFFKFDHVRQGKRQPGSTFKPIVYAAALRWARLSLASERRYWHSAGLLLGRQWRHSLHVKAGHELRSAKLAPERGLLKLLFSAIGQGGAYHPVPVQKTIESATEGEAAMLITSTRATRPATPGLMSPPRSRP